MPDEQGKFTMPINGPIAKHTPASCWGESGWYHARPGCVACRAFYCGISRMIPVVTQKLVKAP